MRYNLYFLKKFNNYHNRKLIRYADLETYKEVAEDYDNPENAKGEPTAVDFNPNDGITTQIVTNWGDRFEPDYLLVCKQTQSGYEIVSRWFVQEWLRTRGQQYQVSLRRDVIADNYNEILNASMFVEKGILDNDNPLIFNNENMTYNQIKKSETLLKDSTEKAWIVGYFNTTENHNIAKQYATNQNVALMSDIPFRPSSQGPLSGFLDVVFGNFEIRPIGRKSLGNYNYEYQEERIILKQEYQSPIMQTGDEYSLNKVGSRSYWGFTYTNNNNIEDIALTLFNACNNNKNAIFENIRDTVSNKFMMRQEYNDLVFGNKVIYDATESKYYRLQLTEYASILESEHITPNRFTNTYSILSNAITSAGATPTSQRTYLYFTRKIYSYTLQDITSEYVEKSYTTKISPTANKLMDAPYSMMFMEFNEVNLAVAQAIAIELDSGMYDLQILPYCPDLDILNKETSEMVEGVDFENIKEGNNTIGKLYYANKSSGSGFIQYDLTVLDNKLSNETQFLRLVSPNYNGAYDFSPAKNGGVNGFYYYFTYKPYSPYIQVQPIFGGVYGMNFNDARGLICNGDFSIATTSDAWKQYEINNKNYENIFNAQVKTNDQNNMLNLARQMTGFGVGAFGGAVGGAMGGNPIMAGVGAMGGLLASGVNIATQQMQYQNNRRLMMDNFGYELGNIKARPDTLNKVSAYNINNKYFPFIEEYDCTDVEKEALRNKIKYNGMTVMTIGKMSEFVGKDYNGLNYFQARLIINEDASMDYHMMSEIDAELQKGIYL